MEIIDYFKSLGGRFWVFLAVPVMAAVVAGGIVGSLEYKYQANAFIASPTLTGVRSARSDGNLYSTELQTVLESELAQPSVLAEISSQAHIPVGKLKDGLSVNRHKPSSFAVISYAGGKPAKVVSVARVAANVAYGHLISYEQAVSRAPLDAADSRLQAAEQALQDLAVKTGTPDPMNAYIVARYEVAHLESKVSGKLSHVNPSAASSDETALEQARGRQATLLDAVVYHQDLVARRDEARTARKDAFHAYIKAQDRLDASNPGQTIHVGTAKRPFPLKSVVIAAGAGTGIALAIELFAQWVSEARRWIRLRRPPSPVEVMA